ncbi:MAG: hypothetical protein M1836_005802 [Candelina mexicana]|nr:MAG: hypothetical protein M1836_005802 [Candelina mexicana]
MAATASGSQDDLRNGQQRPMLASQRAKQEQTGPSEANRTGKFGGYFTLGYKEGFHQWWTSISPAVAEHNVMSFVPYLRKPPTHTETGSAPASTNHSTMSIHDDSAHKAAPITTNSITDPYGPRTWHSNLVKLSGKDRALNEFSVERVGEKIDDNLVILHGYGAGLGFFYKNFEPLSRAQGWKLYALDLLGMGRSSRPSFRIHAKEPQGKITEAENWFIDALEEWRVVKKIDRFTLLAHSLGGYMAVAYALKYPGHLNKLILASPVGIPEDPYAVNAAMPEPGDSTLANEFSQPESDVTQTSNPNIPESEKVGDQNNFWNARTQAEKERDEALAKKRGDKNTPTAPRKPLPKWLTYLWDANISPFSLVRMSGPLGPRFVSGWTSRRFSHLPPEEAQALHNYAYSLFRQRGSGEYALAYILAPGAFARSPLIRRIQGVGRQMMTPPPVSSASSPSQASQPTVTSPTKVRENGIPVVLMYGENDWMDVNGGYAARKKMQEEKERALKGKSEEERKKDNGDSKVVIVKKAGHHVYLDGFEEFNQVMLGEMEDVRRREGR